MWKYTHTDEMYHSLTDGNSNKLFHSDVYLGQDFSDGIKHYKYLKKVKTKSGKWRYIYDETELKGKQLEIDTLKKTADSLRDKDGYIHYVDKNGDSVYRSKENHVITFPHSNYEQKQSDKFKENLINKIEEKEKLHSKQKMKDIPKRLISRGIGAVNKLLMNIEDKWIR